MLISLLQEIPTQKQVDLRLNLDKHGKHALAIRQEVERQYLPKDASRPPYVDPLQGRRCDAGMSGAIRGRRDGERSQA